MRRKSRLREHRPPAPHPKLVLRPCAGKRNNYWKWRSELGRNSPPPPQIFVRRRRRALEITVTEEKLIAAAASIGESSQPVHG